MTGFFAAGRYWDISAPEGDAISRGARRLAGEGIADPLKEARLLWVAAMAPPVDPATDADAPATARFEALIARRAARAPLSHLLGYRDFFAHRFAVSPDVLDPRPDTETLVATALEQPFSRVLDLGTGSGCILLSLLAARPGTQGLGVDLSQAALTVAERNCASLALQTRAGFACSDWFGAVSGRFDLIVSNPPYIAADEMAALQPEVRLHEPRMALTDEADGLTAYRHIITGAPAHITPAGRLIVEIGPTQAAAVSALMAAAGFEKIVVIPDLDGRDRVVAARWPADPKNPAISAK